MLAVQEQMKSLTQSHLHTRSPPAPVHSPRAPRAPAHAAAAAARRRQPQAMSFEEKRWLSEQISALDTEPLITVVKIIHEAHPLVQGNDSSAPDVIEIDIDSLDVAALKKLMTFVKKTTGQSPPSRRGKNSTKRSSIYQSEDPSPAVTHLPQASPTTLASTIPSANPVSDDIGVGVAPTSQISEMHDDASSGSDTDSATTESDDDEDNLRSSTNCT